MSQDPRNPRPAAFTIIELLVVIGIIALLVGMLLPTLARAKRTGQQAACLANVKQIGTSLELFADDHRDDYPTAGHVIDWGQIDTGGTGLPSWMEQTAYYLDAEKVAFNGCPNYPVESPYHYFLSTRAAWVTEGTFAPVHRKLIRRPSLFVLAGDNNYNGFVESVGPITGPDADKDDYTQECLVFKEDEAHWYPQHDGGLNVLFADNHAAYYTFIDQERMTFRYDTISAWE